MALLHLAHRGRAPHVSALAVSGQQQQREQQPDTTAQPAQADPQEQPRHSTSWYRSHYDLDWYHYVPWWLKPGPVLLAGALFFVAALIFDNEEPTLKAAVIASGPVLLFWAIALFVLPSQFAKFAVSYMRKHPELEEQAAGARPHSRGDGAAE